MLNIDQLGFAGFACVVHCAESTSCVVALVEIDDSYPDRQLDTVFELTNTIDKPWWENQEVIKIPKKGCRSTSVGDIIKIADDFWKVAPVGFDKLNGVPEEWQIARAKLNVS